MEVKLSGRKMTSVCLLCSNSGMFISIKAILACLSPSKFRQLLGSSDGFPAAHVESIEVTLGHLRLKLLIIDPQKVKKRPRSWWGLKVGSSKLWAGKDDLVGQRLPRRAIMAALKWKNTMHWLYNTGMFLYCIYCRLLSFVYIICYWALSYVEYLKKKKTTNLQNKLLLLSLTTLGVQVGTSSCELSACSLTLALLEFGLEEFSCKQNLEWKIRTEKFFIIVRVCD